MSEPKYLIVGQGLAGSLLACRMEEAGIPFRIVDDPTLSASSRIAGGIINPVVFKRLVPSDNVLELLTVAEQFYTDLENKLGEKFYSPIPIVKFFGEEQEREFWKRKREEGLQDFLSAEMSQKDYLPSISAPFGYSKVNRAAVLKFNVLLDALRNKWSKEGILVEKKIHYANIKPEGEISWEGSKFEKIIFCEGYKTLQNPWFSEVGLAPAKGEILTVSIPGLNIQEVLNKGVYVIPLGNDKYRVGATFSWHTLNDIPTLEGKEELLLKLKSLIKSPIEVLDHKAGVRPAVVGRKPVLGTHPDYPGIGIFNGLGTKGAMLAPFYSKQMLEFLEGKRKVDSEVDVKRFY